MKPHLPLCLLGLAVACAAPLYAAGDSVSINFSSGAEATHDAGEAWYDASGNAGSALIATDGDHDSSYAGGGTGLQLDYTSKNNWEYITGVTDEMLKGYLDDGGSGITISLSGLIEQGFLSYDLTIYAATDNDREEGSAYSSKNVNGINYTSDGNGGAIANSTNSWGSSHLAETGNGNSFTVSGLSGDLTIKSSGSNNNPRGCIAGITVTNTYAGTRVEAALDNTTGASWTATDLAGSTWTNADSYAALTIAGDNTLTLGTGVNADALIVNGNGDAASLTLTGGDLTLTGPAIISAGNGVVLTISSAVTSDAVVTLNGAQGTIAIDGSMSVHGIQGNGSLVLTDGGKITITGTETSVFTGHLAVADWNNAASSLESTNANWSFAGTAVFNAANTQATDSIAYATLAGYGGTLLAGAHDWKIDGLTLTLAGGDNVSQIITADTVTKTGTGTAVLTNGGSSIGTLNILGGAVELSSSGYQIGTVNVADGGILSLSTIGSNIGGTPTINLADGAGLDFRNSGASGATNTLTAHIVISSSDEAKGVSIGGSYYGNGTNLAGTITGTGSLTFKNSLMNAAAANAFSVSALISDQSESEHLGIVINKPSGTVTFTGANTYTGGTDIQAGTLALSGSGTAGTGTVSIASGGTLRLGSTTTYGNATSGNGTFAVTGGTVTIARGSAGNWQNSFADFHGTIDISGGTLQLGVATEDGKSNTVASLGDGTIKVAGGSVLALATGVITLRNAINLADTARINVLDGTNNAPANYTLSGPVSLAGTATINHSWDKSLKISGLIRDEGEAHGKLVLSGNNNGRFYLSADNNTFSGGIDLNNGALYAEGHESLGTGTTTLAANAALHFTRSGGNRTSATIQAGSAATLGAQPTRSGAAPVYTNVRITTSGIARSNAAQAASVSQASLGISSAYSVDNVALNDTQITLNDNAALTLTDVTLGAGTTLARAAGASATSLSISNATLLLSSTNATIGSDTAGAPATALVSYDMAGAAVTGSFTLDFTGELLRNLATLAGNPFTEIRITLNDVSSWSVAAGDLSVGGSHEYLNPGDPTVDTTQEGKVVITVTFDKVIPEPASATLGLSALLGLMLRRRRKA